MTVGARNYLYFFSTKKHISALKCFVFVKSEVVFALHQAGQRPPPPPPRGPDNIKQKRVDGDEMSTVCLNQVWKKQKNKTRTYHACTLVLLRVDTVICSFLMFQITFPTQLLQKPKMLSLFSFRKYNQWVMYWFEAVQVFIWKSPQPFNFK